MNSAQQPSDEQLALIAFTAFERSNCKRRGIPFQYSPMTKTELADWLCVVRAIAEATKEAGR